MKEDQSPDEVEQKAYDTAIKAIITASNQVLRYWQSPTNSYFDESYTMKIFKKAEGTGNYATTADKESEKIIIELIRKNPLFKDHHIIAEESDEIESESEYQWLIDPIDGTPPFRNGLPEFGISIGLLKEKDPIMGVIAMPALGQLVVARKGQGAKLLSFTEEILIEKLDNQGIKTSLDNLLVGYDLGYENRGEQLEKTISKLADKIGYPVCYGSCSAANFRLSQGLIGAYFFETPKKFDIAAAAAIIPEIGGVVTDMRGQPIDWAVSQRTFLAARSPQIHSQLVEMLGRAA